VKLTAEGRHASARVGAAVEAHYAEVLAGLDGSDRATLADLVRGVLDRLELATGQSIGISTPTS
jgi:DNA-binding MarR family transcriptional regulator